MPKYELNFGDYWRIIKKRRGIIILTFLAVAFFNAIFIYSRPVEYQSSVTVKIEERKTVAGLLLESLVYYGGADTMTTEANIIQSWPVAEATCNKLGLIKDKDKEEIYNIVSKIRSNITTKQIEGTNLIRITVRDKDPVFASQFANTVAESYIEENFKTKTSEARRLREFIEQQLNEASNKLKQSEDSLKIFQEKETISGVAVPIQNRLLDLKMKLNKLLQQYTEIHPHVVELKEQIKNLEEQLSVMPEKELQYARLAREVELNEKSYKNLYQKLQDAQIAEAEKGGNVSIVDPAVKPGTPVQAGRWTNILLGAVIGILLGCIIGFVAENIDTSIGAIEEVEELLKLPVLGVIPNVKIKGTKKRLLNRIFFRSGIDKEAEIKVRLNAYYSPKSLVAESYRTMRTNLKITSQKKVILVTSAVHQEGKSSVVTNLAIVSAQLGDRTLILNCDLRKPVLAKTFGLQAGAGLSEVLSGSRSLREVTKGLMNILMGRIGFGEDLGTSGLDNLFLITAGENISSPAQILRSKEISRIIGELRDAYGLVLLDCPPVLPVTDAMMLAPLVDGIILVYQVGRASRQALLRAKSLLEGAGGRILGVVLNHIHTEESYSTGTYYPYKYYSQEEKPSES